MRSWGRTRAVGVLAVLALAPAMAGCGGSDAGRSITVAAASDLRPAFEQLGEQFTADTGVAVTFSFGSSGLLREQIVNGAPFDLFASANVEFVDDVIAAGRGVAETKAPYALGRIVLWSADGQPPMSLSHLADPAYRRIAIANPQHAPYGQAAKEALESAGVYGQVASRLVYGENISDTYRLAATGNADVGIVALSLAIADGGPYVIIPDDAHRPLEQALVVTTTGRSAADARAFADFLASGEGRRVMTSFGFVLPGEEVSAT